VFDVGFGEFLVLGQAGRALRQVRQMANSAKQDLQEGLGPEFANFDPADLHPRRFVQKHLLSDIDDERAPVFDAPQVPVWDDNNAPPPPFDRDAT
jgi:sec-independent protein translocase protein TatB